MVTEAKVSGTGLVSLAPMEAELAIFKVYGEQTVEYSLSAQYCIEVFLERGEVKSTERQTIHIKQPDIQRFSREGREALLWIWVEQGNKPLVLPDQHRELDISSVEGALVSVAREIKQRRTEEIREIYRWLEGWSYEGSKLFDYIAQLRQVEPVVMTYGPAAVRDLFRERSGQVMKDYNADRQQWVLKYGSEYLQFLLANGYELEEVYVRERLQREYPGFRLLTEEDYQNLRYKILPLPEEIELVKRLPNACVVEDQGGKSYLLIRRFLGRYDICGPMERGHGVV